MGTALLPYVNWLQNHELDFTEINLDEGKEREKFMEKYPYLRTSPQIFCDGRKYWWVQRSYCQQECSNDLR